MHQGEVELAGVPSSVSAARHFVVEILEAAGASDQSWPAVQVISELATNAVVHASTTFVVRVRVEASAVRVAVTDKRPAAFAAKRRFSADTTTGRGLRLVESLSRTWGVDSDEASKTVWSEIVREPVGGSRHDLDDAELTEVLSDALSDPVAGLEPASAGMGEFADSGSITPDDGSQTVVRDLAA
ncbi:MAG: ATP-binding protein [Acidothermaceae bacterium]